MVLEVPEMVLGATVIVLEVPEMVHNASKQCYGTRVIGASILGLIIDQLGSIIPWPD